MQPPHRHSIILVSKTFRLLHCAMKTGIVVGIILTALGLLTLTLLYHPTVTSKILRGKQSVTVDRFDSTKNIHNQRSEEENTEAENMIEEDSKSERYRFHEAADEKVDEGEDKEVDNEVDEEKETTQAGSQSEEYSFHDACPCRRTAPLLSHLERHFDPAKLELAINSSGPWKPVNGSYVGHSTCNRYSLLWKMSTFFLFQQVHLCSRSGPESVIVHLLHTVEQLWRELFHIVEKRSAK